MRPLNYDAMLAGADFGYLTMRAAILAARQEYTHTGNDISPARDGMRAMPPSVPRARCWRICCRAIAGGRRRRPIIDA